MHEALANLEKFLYDPKPMPLLIQCGLVHAQFETIHPFLDGNGRIGRLLITFLLCYHHVLQRPLLYLSHYFKLHRADYYDRLMSIRNDGNWEGWLKFFLRGIAEVSEDATLTARKILDLRGRGRALIADRLDKSPIGQRLFDYLFQQPLVSVKMVQDCIDCSYVTANKLVLELEKLNFLEETTGWKRNRRYLFKPYLELFHAEPFRGESLSLRQERVHSRQKIKQ